MSVRDDLKLALLVLSTALALVLSLVGGASAQQVRNCAPREVVLAALEGKYGETRRAIGLLEGGALIELFGANGGTWTIIVTGPGGLSCLKAAGTDFEAISPLSAAPGDDT